jgi:prostaglandin-E synthase
MLLCVYNFSDLVPYPLLLISRSSQMFINLSVFYMQLFITIDVQDAKDAKTDLDNVDGTGKLTFSGKSGDVQYDLEISFMKEIDVSASQVSVSPRCIFLLIAKTESSSGHWPRLTKESGKQATQHIKCDWDKWVDEDEEDEADKMDFSQYGNFDQFGGGMGGMGGMDEEEDSDDGEEVEGEGKEEDEELPDLVK